MYRRLVEIVQVFLKLLVRIIDGADRAKLESGLVWLFTFVRPRMRAVVGLLGLSVCASLLALAQPWLIKQVIDEGILKKDFHHLLSTALTMVVIGFLSTLLSGASRYFHTQLSGRILFALRESLYGHLQKMAPSFYTNKRVGDILSRVDGDVSEIQRFSIDALFAAVSSIIGLIGAVSLMLVFSWQLTLILCVLVPLEVIWLRYMRRKVQVHAKLLRERSADVSSYLVEKLPAMKFVQACVQESAELKSYSGLGERYMDQLLKLQVVEFLTRAVPGTATSLSRALVFIVGGYWVISGQWQLGALIAFSTYLGMAVGPVQSMLGLYVSVQRMAVSLNRVLEIKDEPVLVEDVCAVNSSNPSGADLVCRDVWFRYPGQEDYVIRNVNLDIRAGSKIALSGISGAGKSTLTDLLLRFYDPVFGRIILGNVDIRDMSLATLRKKVAIVSQDVTLFKGTLKENIAYSSAHSSMSEIERACEQANLADWISSLPNGLETQMGERGQRLSGGQKQRVAIARALLQRPDILILDEATSAVDEQTERKILEQIDLLFSGKTRIIISHRRSTLEGCDNAFMFHDGEVKVRNPGNTLALTDAARVEI